MNSIFGIIDNNNQSFEDRLKRMLDFNDIELYRDTGVIFSLNWSVRRNLSLLNKKNFANRDDLDKGGVCFIGTTGMVPFYGEGQRFILVFNGNIWNYSTLRSDMEKVGHYFKTDDHGEVVLHRIEESYKHSSSLVAAVSDTLKELDGVFVFMFLDRGERTAVLARDPVGVKQLHYVNHYTFVGFSSKRKHFWNLGLKPVRLLPGELIEIKEDKKNDGYTTKNHDLNSIKPNKISITDEATAVKRYKEVLFEAVRKRIEGNRKIGVIFSGGVDSVMIAQVVRELGVEITCYTAGISGASDLMYARKAAEALGFTLRVNRLTEEIISEDLKQIIAAVESTNHLQIDAATPVYFATKLASEDGVKVLLNGQGPDELFAGYSWYPHVLLERGGAHLNACLWNDLKNGYKETFEREENIAKYYGIDLRMPYVDPRVIDVAMSISEELKIKNGTVKYLHRKLAEYLGIPEFIAWRPKEAAQHGSNIHETLRDVIFKSRKEISEENLKQFAGKILAFKVREKLGSVYRYHQDIYSEDKEVQEILDYIGAELDVY